METFFIWLLAAIAYAAGVFFIARLMGTNRYEDGQ